MKLTLTQSKLAAYTAGQMNAFFPDGNTVDADCVAVLLPKVLARLGYSLGSIGNSYFSRDGDVYFNHLHSDQYSMYLYLLGNEAYGGGRLLYPDVAAKSYLLNKALNGIEAYYEVQLPDVFWFCHPVGSVIGRAKYGRGFVVMHGCTIGNKGGTHPVLGDRVVLCAGATVVGGRLGSDVCIGAGSLVVGEDIPDGCTVVGCSPNLRVIPRKSELIDRYFLKGDNNV